MYGLYGLKHHIVDISEDVTDAGRTTNKQTNKQMTRKDRATQPLDVGRLRFAIWHILGILGADILHIFGILGISW